MSVTNEADKGCEPGDMGDHVTVGLDKMVEVYGYAIERGGLYMCFDRHSDKGEQWGLWGEAFMCAFDTPGDASRWMHPGDKLRVVLCDPVCRPGDGL